VPQPGQWTLDAARAALPEVKRRLAEARGHLSAMRVAEEQLNDLRIVHGEQVLAIASPGHTEFKAYLGLFNDARAKLHESMLGLSQLGVEVKDIEQGLLDFRGLVGATPAYLCWKDGEDDIAWWHPLDEGFQGRRRLP
jgi:hypothetical protein